MQLPFPVSDPMLDAAREAIKSPYASNWKRESIKRAIGLIEANGFISQADRNRLKWDTESIQKEHAEALHALRPGRFSKVVEFLTTGGASAGLLELTREEGYGSRARTVTVPFHLQIVKGEDGTDLVAIRVETFTAPIEAHIRMDGSFLPGENSMHYGSSFRAQHADMFDTYCGNDEPEEAGDVGWDDPSVNANDVATEDEIRHDANIGYADEDEDEDEDEEAA